LNLDDRYRRHTVRSTRVISTIIAVPITHPATTSTYTLSLHDALPICHLEDLLAIENQTEFIVENATPDFLDGLEQQIASTNARRSEEHTSELQSRRDLVCRLLLEKKRSSPPSRSPWGRPRAQALSSGS